jgi:hypothetical protein
MAANPEGATPLWYGLGFGLAALSGCLIAVQSGINATLGAHGGQAFASIMRWGAGAGRGPGDALPGGARVPALRTRARPPAAPPQLCHRPRQLLRVLRL